MGASIHVIGSMMIDRVVRVRTLPRAGETVAAISSAPSKSVSGWVADQVYKYENDSRLYVNLGFKLML
jgi:hypothetical protein